jgi:hypothetical protein
MPSSERTKTGGTFPTSVIRPLSYNVGSNFTSQISPSATIGNSRADLPFWEWHQLEEWAPAAVSYPTPLHFLLNLPPYIETYALVRKYSIVLPIDILTKGQTISFRV